MVPDSAVSGDRGEPGGEDAEGKERRDSQAHFLYIGSVSTSPAARFCRQQAGVSALLLFALNSNNTVQKPVLLCKMKKKKKSVKTL